MGGGEGKGGGPVFRTCYCRGMNHELIALPIKRRRRLQSPQKSPMPQLRLRIRADNLPRLDERHPIRLLLGTRLQSQRRPEHQRVVAEGRGDDEFVFVGVGVEFAVAMLNLVFHEDFAEFESLEVVAFAVLVRVGFGEFACIGEAEGVFDAGEGCFVAGGGFFAGGLVSEKRSRLSHSVVLKEEFVLAADWVRR